MLLSKRRLGVSVAVAAAATTALAGTAQADIGPSRSDVVGVGSDTVQNIMNFLADGDNSGAQGYNGANGVNRLFSFDATPDQNDRAGYLNGSTSTTLKPLNPTVVLRRGTSPIQRPNGSGAGITAFNKDVGPNATLPVRYLDYVRSSRLPSVAEQNTAVNNGWGGLHVVKISTDELSIAVNKATTNAPAALSPQQLVDIYKCTATTWTAVGGTSTNTIIPVIPQSGSGTRSTFLADLQTANGGTAVTPGSCVRTDEENDPASITGSSAPADTIAPFSGGRIRLFDSGYFTNPNTIFPGGAALTSGVQLLTGATASDGNANYLNNRGLYIVFRDSDLANTAPFQPGGTRNWARTLFANPGSTIQPFVNTSAGRTLITSGGSTPAYVDCGAGPTITSC